MFEILQFGAYVGMGVLALMMASTLFFDVEGDDIDNDW